VCEQFFSRATHRFLREARDDLECSQLVGREVPGPLGLACGRLGASQGEALGFAGPVAFARYRRRRTRLALPGGLSALEDHGVSGPRYAQLAHVTGRAHVRLRPGRTLGALGGFEQNLGASALGGGRLARCHQAWESVPLVWAQIDFRAFGWQKTSLPLRVDCRHVGRRISPALRINLTVAKD